MSSPQFVTADEGSSGKHSLPMVSIVIPCRNEVDYIGSCLESILAGDFPEDRLEVLVADGMSTDGTRAIIDEWTARHTCIRRVDNPARVTPAAFNAGVRAATGDLIMIMSAHASYASDAISKCVEYSARYGADNVGGLWKIVPRGTALLDSACALALSHKFGVGGASYRTGVGTEPVWVDTAAYGCYRRDVFERIGYFNERLHRGQDMEFNLRLRKAGGRTLLAPDVVITYFARTQYLDFCRHNWRNGVWVIIPFLYSDVIPVSPRHLVPLAFALSVLLPALLALAWPQVIWISALALVAYGTALAIAAVDIGRTRRDWRMLLAMLIVFPSIHFPYGFGSLYALLVQVPRHYARLLFTRLRASVASAKP